MGLYFCLGFILAIFIPLIYRLGRNFSYSIISAYSLGFTFLCAQSFFLHGKYNTVLFSYPWLPQWGLYFSLKTNAYSLFFGLLISFIGTFIFLYSLNYFSKGPKESRFLMIILLFMMSMLGIVFSNNLLLTFFFWELTGITSFLLIGYSHNLKIARENAKTALLVTGLGDVFFLVALVFIYKNVNTFQIDTLLSSELGNSKDLYTILGCLCMAAFTKSAQFPFHFWLPRAMVAPTPVSAFLHSATMVKAGVFLTILFFPLFKNEPLFLNIFICVGSITAFLGAFMSVYQKDMKRLLAFSTISSLGIIFVLIGQGTEVGLIAALTYILTHALYKSSLFLVVGSIDHHMKGRNLTDLHSLKHFLPLTSIVAFMALISMIGLPPAIGYLAKHLLYESTYNNSLISLISISVANMLMVMASLKFLMPFFVKNNKVVATFKDHSLFLWLPPFILAASGIIFGLMSSSLTDLVISRSYLSVTNSLPEYTFSLFHKPDILLAIGVLVLILAFVLLKYVINLSPLKQHFIDRAYKAYQVVITTVLKFAKTTINKVQDGDYWKYIITIFLFTIACLAPFVAQFKINIPFQKEKIDFLDLSFLILINSSCILALIVNSRLASVIAAGGIGLGVTLIFGLYGAPDLALTQMMVEILTLVLLLIAIRRLPIFNVQMSRGKKYFSFIVAFTLAFFLALISVVALDIDSDGKVSQFFAENSYILAKGKNIVNVILVDFRGLDTLGEITVLCLAGLGVLSLLKVKKGKNGL
ncbi:MAG: proton-conducting transporter membrane subunit [Bdellovibrionales bacterium]|nr:proton-conducting transporter membrane subunit [Bdellovibrionales bacterium]